MRVPERERERGREGGEGGREGGREGEFELTKMSQSLTKLCMFGQFKASEESD